jgi:hypothetical protein
MFADEEELETERINQRETLLELLIDKKSPWFEINEWSDEADTARLWQHQHTKPIRMDKIEKHFKSLRFVNEKVK